MSQKPSIPKGTRDFLPLETARRNYIFDTIKEQFRLFGYSQIETPAIENLSTLMGKYGDEGDKLLFKILNSGDFMKSVSPEEAVEKDSRKLLSKISEKGLRYDLTVPFARFVTQYRNELQLPFKRFQIQPVWRADRPQKGRYREFYQCDADVVGSSSLWNDVELLSMVDTVFCRLGIKTVIKLNNRKILAGIAEVIGAPEKIIDITVAIDKIDKIGLEKVEEELLQKELSQSAISQLEPLLKMTGNNEDKLTFIKDYLKKSETGQKGVEELEEVIEGIDALGHKNEVEIDISLARGLNYYTGTIIEVKACDVEMGSIAGGGRYDNLTGVFGMEGVSGIGVSFGADRIYDVLSQLNLFPENVSESVTVMFVNFGKKEALESAKIIKRLREEGVSAELYPDTAKMKKQMTYADSRKVPYVAMIGEEEMEKGEINLKNMVNGEQTRLKKDELIEKLKNTLNP